MMSSTTPSNLLDSRHTAVRVTIVHDQHKAGDPTDEELDHALALAADRCESGSDPTACANHKRAHVQRC